MKAIIQLFLTLVMATSLYGQDCHSRGRTQNNLLPDVKFTLIPRSVTEDSAVAFLAEAGRRNFRFNGTYGMLLNDENRFKVSGEYLQQKLKYNYTPGTAKRWMRQFACGAAFEHDFYNDYIMSGDISAYYSYSPSRSLDRGFCGNFAFNRKISGATAYGGEIGTTIRLWSTGFLFADANYDYVIYRRRLHVHNKHVQGFGGSIGFHQQFYDNVGLDLRAEFRRPFNYYRASLSWAHPQWTGVTIGIFGSHLRGKCSLPSNTVAGIELNYVFSSLFKPSYDCREALYCAPELACWVSDPAVYMPEVLAIAEEKLIVPMCPFPVSIPIPNVNLIVSGPFVIDVSPFFSSPDGFPLTFSALGLPPGAVIDPVTGIITGIAGVALPPATITVFASNACGTTSQTFILSFCTNVPTSTTIPPFATCAPGPFSYPVGTFFTNPPGSNPLVFSATGLPGFATIDPATGTISGVNVGDANVYNVTVTADNGCSSTSQAFTMTFTCPAPTSSPIADIELPLTAGTPYVLDVVTGNFTSPCGQPFTYTQTGLPVGSSINPVTGVITGVSPGNGPYTVTITGTTACGVTQQTFDLDFSNA